MNNNGIFKLLIGLLSFFVILTVIGLLFVNIISLVISIPQVYPHVNEMTLPFFILSPLPPFLAIFASISGISLLIWFWLLCVAIFGSFSYFILKDFLPYAKTFFKSPIKCIMDEDSSIRRYSEFFAINIFVVVIVVLTTWLFGTSPNVPSSIEENPTWSLMISLANASVYEELISRALLIGLPLMIIYIAMKKMNFKHGFKILLGGNIKIGNIELIFLLISSILFGLAHVSGWDIYKLPSTLVGGMIFGYLFLRYGLYMSILFHFTINYLLITESLYGDIFLIFLGSTIIFWAFVGGLYSIKYLRNYISPLSKESEKSDDDFTPIWHKFVCSTCGNNIFHYLPNNQIKCTNCGGVYQMQGNSQTEDNSAYQ